MTRILVRGVIPLAFALATSPIAAQTRIIVTDVGPGAGGQMLREALTKPHRIGHPDTAWYVVSRGEHVRATIIVLGRTAAIGGQVSGDVVVVDGDLHVRPGAMISGRAVAIGGGVYPSAAAIVTGGTHSFRDNTYAIRATPDGYALAYQSLRAHATPPLLLPGVYGLRVPAYDRVSGATLPYGPTLTFLDGRGQLDALVTYRSDLGAFDPGVRVSLQLSRRLRARIEAERGTFTNDGWIWSNLVNSMASLGAGKDTRNYYRADRGEATLHRLWETATARIEPFAGARMERGWSVGPARGEQGGPWSIFNRTDTLGMRRPNPAILTGTIASALAGASVRWEGANDVRVQLRSSAEYAFEAPTMTERFGQVTSDLAVDFPTFGEQTYSLEVHWVTSPGDTPPPQRFAYLGGSGTLTFLELLEQGGDELLFVDQRYSYPLTLRLGILGSPTLHLRHRLGSAGLGGLPAFEQVLGLGVTLVLLRAEIQVDPAGRDVRFSAGLSFSR